MAPLGSRASTSGSLIEEIGELQPLVGRAGIILVMDGRIDNRDELLPALRLSPTTSDAACVLAAYEAWGERFAERLNGDFAIAIFNAATRQLILVRDSIGVRPLYYFRNDRLFAFASEIKALLAHPDIPAQPHEDGIADYLLLSARPVDQQQVTCFVGVSALVPAHVAIVTPERTETRRYWDFDTARAIRFGSFEECAEAFRERFAEAVRRRIRSAFPVAVSVSGGLDSSSIFSQAETLRKARTTDCPEVVGISYVGEAGTDSDERRYLADLERQYRVEIEQFPIEPLVGLVDGAEDQIYAIEAPFFDYMWGVTRELHRRASVRGARVLLTGTWGDQVLFSCGYLVDLFRRLAWGTIWRHLREYRRWVGEPVARVLAQRFAVDVVRQHLPGPLVTPLKYIRRRLMPQERPKRSFSDQFLRRALRFADRRATTGHGFHSVHARSLYFEARSKYHVHCLEWNNKIGASRSIDVALPFLDRDLVAFLMAIPGEMQNWNGVPRALMREAMRGVLPEPVRRRNWKANFTEIVEHGRGARRARLSPGAFRPLTWRSIGLSGPRTVVVRGRRLSAGLTGPDCVASWSLADLSASRCGFRYSLGNERIRDARPRHGRSNRVVTHDSKE